MTFQPTFRFYVLAFLAFCVASSKHIIIYNEETLVACSFFLFVFFVARSFGDTITASLQERGHLIQQELHHFLQVKQHALEHSAALHQRVSQVGHLVAQVEHATVQELTRSQSHGARAVRTQVIDHMDRKLKTLTMAQYAIQHTLQHVLADHVRAGVLYTFAHRHHTHPSQEAVGAHTIQRALALLHTSRVVS
jgi:F0F1-type ATP synthase membrane subunit b/b'